jgi:serine/threonine protein kinase
MAARGRDASQDVRMNGGNANAGAARSHVHSVRPVGSLIGDRFVIKAHLGRGRSGERYEAVDRSLSDPNVPTERCVVVHFLNGRIAQQTRVLQKLETSYHQPHSWAHRNLFSVLGFGSDHGEYFFVTEELEGGTLRTILDEVTPELLSEEEAFGVLSGIGDALKYAHAKGVVHGDIRPENVFVTRDLVVKVLDLLPATMPRTVPLFPEDNSARAGAIPDSRDDVYGLACVAYELFAGKHPFNSNNALEALAAGLKPAPIPRLDARSWDALVRGLALRRDQRTPTVAAFLAGLGVTGRERLRRENEDDRADASVDIAPDIYESAAPEPRPYAPPARAPAAGERVAGARTFDDGDRYDLFRIRRDEPASRSGRWLAWAAALAIVGAAAYWNRAWLEERGPELVTMGRGLVDKVAERNVTAPPHVDSDSAASTSVAAAVPPPAPDAAPAGSAPNVAGTAPSAGKSAPAAAPPARSGSSSARADVGPAPAKSAPAPAPSVSDSSSNVASTGGAPISKAPSTPPSTASPQAPATADGSPSRAPPPPQPTAAAAAAESSEPESFEPEKPVVVVSESSPSAAITIHRHGKLDGNTTFVWWTTDGTAVADEDYINFGARIEKLGPGEQTRTIHIPIVNDSKPEGRESFYVNVRPGQGKREDPAQRVEVIIEDDD